MANTTRREILIPAAAGFIGGFLSNIATEIAKSFLGEKHSFQIIAEGESGSLRLGDVFLYKNDKSEFFVVRNNGNFSEEDVVVRITISTLIEENPSDVDMVSEPKSYKDYPGESIGNVALISSDKMYRVYESRIGRMNPGEMVGFFMDAEPNSKLLIDVMVRSRAITVQRLLPPS